MDIHEYLVGRWHRIHALEKVELRRASGEKRLRQFLSLFEMARFMNWETSTPAEIEEVRRRWRKIKGCGE
jgi:hypothetical protein